MAKTLVTSNYQSVGRRFGKINLIECDPKFPHRVNVVKHRKTIPSKNYLKLIFHSLIIKSLMIKIFHQHKNKKIYFVKYSYCFYRSENMKNEPIFKN